MVIAPLRLTLWVLVVGTAVVVGLITILTACHVQSARANRRRERVRGELGPVFSRFLESEDPGHLADELRPALMRMNAAERAVAAVYAVDLMQEASASQAEQFRSTLERAGIVALGERGTRRFSPWRRALASEALGRIGAPSSVPAVLERLEDRRPEVRISAVRALGDIGSVEAVPALTEAFLQRRVAPTNIVSDALRRIGGGAVTAFEQGVVSLDPVVRVSSCFGLAGVADEVADPVSRLAEVLASDADARVRGAAADGLGMIGGNDVPGALLGATGDAEAHVRRSAVQALGCFDDPTTGETLSKCAADEDRETALRAAEALIALTHRPRAAREAHARLESSSAWAVQYVCKVAEVTGASA